jgi:pilus assembly protein Flp/PilA
MEVNGMLLGLFAKAQTWWFATRERFGDERGAVATEYALLLLLIALAIVGAASLLGSAIAQKFTNACTSLSGNC